MIKLFLYAIPNILASMIVPLSAVVDTLFLGRLNNEWVIALGVATTIQSCFFWTFNFILVGATSNIGLLKGSSNWPTIHVRIKQTLLASFAIALCSSFALYALRPVFYSFMHVSSDLASIVDRYYLVRLFGLSFSFVTMGFTGILRGLGHRYAPFLSGFVTTAINVYISYYCLYNLKMDLAGAAYGTIIGEFFGLLFIIGATHKYWGQGTNFWSSIFRAKIAKHDWSIYSTQSLFIFLKNFTWVCVHFITGAACVRLNPIYMGVFQFIMQLLLIVSFFMDGFAILGNMELSRMLGENNFDKMRKLKKELTYLGIVVAGVLILSFFIFHEALFSFMTIDSQTKAILTSLVYVIILQIFIQSQTDIFDGIIYGLNLFRWSSINMISSALFAFIPCILMAMHFKDFTYILLSRTAFSTSRLIFNIIGSRSFFQGYCRQYAS